MCLKVNLEGSQSFYGFRVPADIQRTVVMTSAVFGYLLYVRTKACYYDPFCTEKKIFIISLTVCRVFESRPRRPLLHVFLLQCHVGYIFQCLVNTGKKKTFYFIGVLENAY